MNRFHATGRLAILVGGLAAALPALCGCAVFVAIARPPVPPGADPRRHPSLASQPPRPPGWNKHPPLPDPARVHAALAGAIPGWQLTLMAATVVLLAATLITIAYPGPGRAVADGRTSSKRVTASGAAGGQPIRSADGRRPPTAAGTKAESGTASYEHLPPPAVRAGMQAVTSAP
jgi:hypothetical protein